MKDLCFEPLESRTLMSAPQVVPIDDLKHIIKPPLDQPVLVIVDGGSSVNIANFTADLFIKVEGVGEEVRTLTVDHGDLFLKVTWSSQGQPDIFFPKVE